MSQISHSRPLPAVIERTLHQVRWYAIGIAIVESVAISAAVFIGLLILAMTLDWIMTISESGVRTLISGIVYAVSAAVLSGNLWSRISRVLTNRQLSMRIDRQIPQLEERWSTVVQLNGTNGRPVPPLQQQMLSQVTSEAVALSSLVEPRQISRSETLKSALVAMVMAILLLAGFLSIHWQQTSVLWQRFFQPTLLLTATQLDVGEVVSPLARGEIAELKIIQSGVLRQHGVLTIEYESGHEEQLRLNPEADLPEHFVHSLRAGETFRFRFAAGDALTEWHSIRVIDAPDFEQVELTVIAPEYTGQEPHTTSILPRHLSVLQGSHVRLRFLPTEQLRSFELNVMFSPDQAEAVSKTLLLQSGVEGWYEFETQLTEDLKLTPHMISREGLAGELTRSCTLHVLVDKQPIARVVGPQDERAMATDDQLEFRLEAHDDFAVQKATLVIYSETEMDEQGMPKILATQEIDLGDQQGQKTVSVDVAFDLKSLDLAVGENISYAVRVEDNRDLTLDDERIQRTDSGFEKMAAEQNAPGEDASPQANQGQSGEANDSSAQAGNRIAGEQNDLAAQMLRDRRNEKEPALSGSQNSAESQPQGVPAKQPGEDIPKPAGSGADTSPAGSSTGENESERSMESGTGKGNPDIPPAVRSSEDVPAGTGSSDQNRPAGSSEMSANSKNSQAGKNQNGTRPPAPARNQQNPRPATSSDQPDGEQMDDQSPPPDLNFFNRLAQQGETRRMKIRIAERLVAVVKSDETADEQLSLREWIVELESRLGEMEAGMTQLTEHQLRDADRPELMKLLDEQFGQIEQDVAKLREQTKETRFAFVGLQMMEISRMHISPARDFLFRATHQPDSVDSLLERSQRHVIRARELLQALLMRYDRVERERKTAKALEEGIHRYDVYVEKAHQLMREATQNRNPLDRKMAVVTVDQDYLDRYAEVRRLRREMLREFSQLLADDPRLLSRFLGLVQRRGSSLRNQLSDLHERQEEIARELSGWNAIEPDQRDDLWVVVLELRLYAIDELTKQISEFAERAKSQLPLRLENSHDLANKFLQQIDELDVTARQSEETLQKWMQTAEASDAELLRKLSELMQSQQAGVRRSLDRLGFEFEGTEDVTEYVDNRRLELQGLQDLIDNWHQIVKSTTEKNYSCLANQDQIRLTIETEDLRSQMQGIEEDLELQFQQEAETDLPEEIADLIHALKREMETITLVQQSSTFRLEAQQLVQAEARLNAALEHFARAEELFDAMRRKVIEYLDEAEVRNPNIADLEDPTLDRFLAQLEREPGIDALLGIPNRPRNLRELTDLFTSRGSATSDLEMANQESRNRTKEMIQMEQKKTAQSGQNGEQQPNSREQESEEERVEREQAEQRMKEMLDESVKSIEDQLKMQNLSPQERERLQQLKKELQKLQQQSTQQTADAARWQQFAEADQLQQAVRAIARGEPVPDEQWNRVLSTLAEGLWQMKGDLTPEEYRKAIEQYQGVLRQLTQPEQEDRQ